MKRSFRDSNGEYFVKTGTPKTLTESIEIGLFEYGFENREKIAKIIEPHVRDYLAQKFGVSFLESGDDQGATNLIKTLWEKIIA